MNGVQVSHGISSRMREKTIVKPTATFFWCSLACKQPNTSPKFWTTGSRHKLWATTSDVWKQNYLNGCNFSRKDWRGDFQARHNQIRTGDAEKSSTICDVQKNIQDPLVQAILLFLIMPAKSWIGIMRGIYAAQIWHKWNCRSSFTTSEMSHFVSIGSVWNFKKVGRSKEVLSPLPSPNVCSVHYLKGRSVFLEQK